MTTANLFDDYDEQSQNDLRGMKFLDFNQMENSLSKIQIKPSAEFRSKFHDFNNTPYGISYVTDDPISIYPYTGKDENGNSGYEYSAGVLPCPNGSDVYREYLYNKYSKGTCDLSLFYETYSKEKSNLFGPFYLSKMGSQTTTAFDKLSHNPMNSSIAGKSFKSLSSLDDVADYLVALAKREENHNLDKNLVYNALVMELQSNTGKDDWKKLIDTFTTAPEKVVNWCAEKLDLILPTEKNYDPSNSEYSPLFPIPSVKQLSNVLDRLDENPFVKEVEAIFSEVWDVIKSITTKIADAVNDYLPDAVRALVTKISKIVDQIKSFIVFLQELAKQLLEFGEDVLKMVNAFYCGIYGGLIGLVQCVLYVAGFLLSPRVTFSYEEYIKSRDKQEKIEDVLDFISENAGKVFDGVKLLFNDLIVNRNFDGAFEIIKLLFANVDKYTAAYYTGLVAFEVLTNIVLLVFTDGVGNVVKGVTYLQKAGSLLKVLLRETISVVTMGITDLLVFLGKFLFRFLKACFKGLKGFAEFIKELLQGFKNGAKAEDLVDDIEPEMLDEVVVEGKKLSEGVGASKELLPKTAAEKRVLAKEEARAKRLEDRKKGKKYRVEEGAGSTKHITKEKFLDKTATLGEVRRLETEIINETHEFGVFVDETGNPISHKFTDNNPKGVDIPTMVDLSTRKYKRIFIHNHPESSPISTMDIMTFIKGDMDELRAVCKNGDIYALIKKGNLPSEGREWKELIDRIITRVKTENAGLIEKAGLSPKGSAERFLYDQKIADTWIEELGELIEYVKYQ